MNRPIPRLAPSLTVLVLLALPVGCGEMSVNSVGINPTPKSVLEPEAPPEPTPKAEPAKKAKDAAAPKETAPASSKRTTSASAPGAPPDRGPGAGSAVALVPIKFAELKGRIAADKGARLTMVDAWSTTCAPCKENFPHVVRMHETYARKGLAVVSLALDDPEDAKAVRQAEDFLRENHAAFTNLRLSESPDAAYEGLSFFTIPAVFLFDTDGNLLKKFTWDDPNNQFTYDEVEKVVAGLLAAKSVPGEG